jgi:hypothetical protein
MRRVWDAVIVASEADLTLLEARFREFEDLDNVVHVIAESPVDHQGNPKPLHFADTGHADGGLWGRWHGRWNHVRVEAHELPQGDPKARKDALREYLAHGVAAEPDDIVLHGAIDELPSERTIKALLAGEAHLPVGMEMRWCAYEPGLVHPRGPWRGTVAQEWRLVGSFVGMRDKRTTLPAIVNAGTRLSMLGEETPEDGKHPDGHALLKAQVDGTWPKWVHVNFPAS